MTISYSKLTLNYQMLLDIDMVEGNGLLAHCIARPQLVAEDHTMTLTGPPTWVQIGPSNITVLSFNPATPDFLELAAADSVTMDFQVGAFSVAAWIYLDDITVDRYILERGLLNTDGWYFYVLSTGNLAIVTCQGAVIQMSSSPAGAITIGGWWFVAATRLANDCLVYINGSDATRTFANHINPAACARKLHVGIDDTEAANQWDGYIWRPRIWNRQLQASEIAQMFEIERVLFGV